MEENWRWEPLGGGVRAVVSPEHGFGADAILLADFARPKAWERACDLGSGCGIIPLLWSREERRELLYGVELQEQGCRQAWESARANGLEDQIVFLHRDLRGPLCEIAPGSLHLVACNPPYQKADAGRISQSQADRYARHELTCTMEDTAACASRLLRFGGRFAICQRPARLCEAMLAMSQRGLEPKRLRFVHKRAQSSPWLFLLEGKKGGRSGMQVLPPLIVHTEEGGYTQEMLSIYGSVQ